jgi:hypothetical protein
LFPKIRNKFTLIQQKFLIYWYYTLYNYDNCFSYLPLELEADISYTSQIINLTSESKYCKFELHLISQDESKIEFYFTRKYNNAER